MRKVVWKNEDGWKRVSLVRDGDGDEFASSGIPVNVPDINDLAWEEIQRDLNNLIVDNGLFNWNDILHKQDLITGIVVEVLRKRLIMLYKINDLKGKE